LVKLRHLNYELHHEDNRLEQCSVEGTYVIAKRINLTQLSLQRRICEMQVAGFTDEDESTECDKEAPRTLGVHMR